MSHEIRIPYRDRSDPLPAVADAARALEGDDRAVARQIVLRGMTSGVATVGDLLDELDAMSPAERRALLDQARVGAGLPSTAEVSAAAARKVRAPLIPDSPPRDAAGCAIQICPAEGCGRYPLSPVSGATIPVKARRWWCPAHQHLASPHDMEPWTAPLVAFGPGGALVFPAEQAREAELAEREAERRALELEQRRAQRIKEWSAMQSERAAQADQFRRATLPGAPP
jgi:hypothetical protein